MLPSRGLTYPPDKAYLKMIFLFPRWDMLVPWRVVFVEGTFSNSNYVLRCFLFPGLQISWIAASCIHAMFFLNPGVHRAPVAFTL